MNVDLIGAGALTYIKLNCLGLYRHGFCHELLSFEALGNFGGHDQYDLDKVFVIGDRCECSGDTKRLLNGVLVNYTRDSEGALDQEAECIGCQVNVDFCGFLDHVATRVDFDP